MGKKVWLLLFAAQIINFAGLGQLQKEEWIDSVMSQMDVTAKIGQLLMIQVNAYDKESELREVETLIENFNLGGIVFTGGSPGAVRSVSKRLNQQSKIPLLFGLNAEEGLGASLDSATIFPPPLMMGAVQSDSLMYFVGHEIGVQLKDLGMHFSFGPTVDLSRSFLSDELIYHTYGDDKNRVASKAIMYIQGMKDAGVMPIAKYYSNNAISVKSVRKGNAVIDNTDDPEKLFPIESISAAGAPGILCASRQEPIFPTRRKLLKSKSRKVSKSVPALYTAQYLKQNFGFDGVVVSYIPEVKPALKKRFRAGDSEVYAFKAGNDILLSPKNFRAGIRKLRRAIRGDKELAKRLDQSVKKILAFKYGSKPTSTYSTDTENLRTTLLINELIERSVTIVKDDNIVLPVKILDNRRFACISIGNSSNNTFSQYLSKYANIDRFKLQELRDTVNLLEVLGNYDVVFVGIFSGSSDIEDVYVPLLSKLDQKTRLVNVFFTPPSRISLMEHASTIVEAYLDDEAVQRVVPQTIFGALGASASLPLNISDRTTAGSGIKTYSLGRLGYSFPAAVGFDKDVLQRVDQIAQEAIREKATPGCQVIIARRGKIIYEKNFGHQTYDKKTPITNETIYDLASVTKVAATLQGIMFLYDKGLIDVNKKISYYLQELQNSNKKDITIKDILTHQAGLWPFVPFWMQTKKDSLFMPEYYSKEKSDTFPYQVAPHLYGVKTMRDSIWSWIVKSRMRDKVARTPYNYTYSDIGLYLMFRLNEKLLNQNQEDFLVQNLYEPLGANSMGYLPLNRFAPDRIAPTELDNLFRRELLIGTVHDEGAAMNGGIAGHAGLFGSASDLAKLGQMLLQKGSYGGIQYYKKETVELFTARQFETSRRGLGWDKPVISEWNSPTSVLASPKTFGHTGFTGTCIWVDPEFDLVYVFLSNRVYPTRNSNKLSSLNIRSRIQDTIYESIFNYCQYENPVTWIKSK